MSRYALKVDTTQAAIIEALRKAGARVDVIGKPVDLLIYFRGRFTVMEVKTPYGKRDPKPRVRKCQSAQNEFIAATHCAVVSSATEALLALSIEMTA